MTFCFQMVFFHLFLIQWQNQEKMEKSNLWNQILIPRKTQWWETTGVLNSNKNTYYISIYLVLNENKLEKSKMCKNATQTEVILLSISLERKQCGDCEGSTIQRTDLNKHLTIVCFFGSFQLYLLQL